MSYSFDKLPIHDLLVPVVSASAALARLDERLHSSPVRTGWIERTHFLDAAAALWLEGELVQMEDLVLHDERMDVRAPTHELTRAHAVLRARRRIHAAKPDWALSRAGLRELAGLSAPQEEGPADQSRDHASVPGVGHQDDELVVGATGDKADPLAAHFAALDAVLERANLLLDGKRVERRPDSVEETAQPVPLRVRSELVYDLEWDESARMAEWTAVLERTEGLPAMLRAVVLLDAWEQINVLQHGGWLGGLLVASLLRREGLTLHHLPCLHLGSRAIARERRRSPDQTRRLLAFLSSIEAAVELGIKEHDKLMLAKAQMERRLAKRRSNSRLPELIELVLARPMVSTTMIQKALKVTQQGATNLVEELALREMTGRKRFRAWGVL